MQNPTRDEKVTRIMIPQVAGTSDTLTSDSIDMQGFEGVKIVVSFGAIISGAVTKTTLQQSANDSSYADLEGSSVTVADDDDNDVVLYDLYRPIDRYIQVDVVRATQNAVINGIWAIQYGARKKPTTDDATVIERNVLISPDEGTP